MNKWVALSLVLLVSIPFFYLYHIYGVLMKIAGNHNKVLTDLLHWLSDLENKLIEKDVL